jgi:hypothetical protein
MIFDYVTQKCLYCGLYFMPVVWIPWRANGYCSRRCDPAEWMCVWDGVEGEWELKPDSKTAFGAAPEPERFELR